MGEWWRFDFRDWRKYRIGNIPFYWIGVNGDGGGR
jgi:hypothetical protein